MRTAMPLVVMLAAAVPICSTGPADPPVMRAMQEELARTPWLKLKDQPAPYYVAFAVHDVCETRVRATLGTLTDDRTVRLRMLTSDVRSGDYSVDSSRFLGADRAVNPLASLALSMTALPTDDDEMVIRRAIWLAADGAYKRSVQVLARKKAALQNRSESDPIADLSREPAIEHIEPVPAASPVPAAWRETVRQLSDTFRVPEVVSSEVQLVVEDGARYFVSSEGSRIAVPARSASLRLVAETQADDGMSVQDVVELDVAALEDLGAAGTLQARARQMLDGLRATRAARVGEDYSGPVLVENDAAATLVAQALVPLFLSRRAPETDDPRMAAAAGAFAGPFLTRIGTRVLPESFTVRDTPSVTRVGGAAMGGAYTVDDEGVRAQDVTLVENGRLATMLTSRTPQRNLPRSNGHGRDGGAQAGVFQIEASKGLAGDALKRQYLGMLKDQGRTFGYIIRRLAPGAGRQGIQVVSAVRVTPDGREEPVRGLVVGAMSHTVFRDIAAASRERTALTCHGGPGMALLFGAMPAPGGGALVSVVTPSLLFEELDVQKDKEPIQKKPRVPSPIR